MTWNITTYHQLTLWVQIIFNGIFLQTPQFDCLDFIVKVKTS